MREAHIARDAPAASVGRLALCSPRVSARRRRAARQVLYALTAGVAGYVSAVSYKMLGGDSWVRNVLLTTALFCGPLLATFSFLNTVAIVYRTTTALPFGTIVVVLVIWALITFPLTVLGGIAGKNSKARPRSLCWQRRGVTDASCRKPPKCRAWLA